MKIYIQGNGYIELRKKDFIAQGGEGAVYARGKIAYKVYSNPSLMIPVAKIEEFSVLDHEYIIRQENILYNSKG